MAHESSEKVMSEMARSVSKAGGVGAMGKGMMGEGAMGPMMGEGMMGPMMGGMMSEGAMGPMMGEGMMGSIMGGMPMASSAGGAGMAMGGMATGAAITAAGATRKSLAKRILGHPAVLIGLGFAVGFLVHKYRKEIISSLGLPAAGPQETLEGLVAEGGGAGDQPTH